MPRKLVLGVVVAVARTYNKNIRTCQGKRIIKIVVDMVGLKVYKSPIQAEVGTSADGKVGNTL